MHRIRATIPPSVVRLPPPIRNPWLRMLTAPVVLFFHPWEFVDFREARELPLDCRFATGSAALRAVRETIELYRNRGASFKTIAQVCA